jgi:hypothetical protein
MIRAVIMIQNRHLVKTIKRGTYSFLGCSHPLQIVVYPAGAMGSTVDKMTKQASHPPLAADEAIGEIEGLVNASGHVQELDRNFGFWTICAISVVSDNAWAAGGGSLVRSLLRAS